MDIPYGFLTVDEAARELDLPRDTVLWLLERDMLHGLRVGSSWRINPWSLLPLIFAQAEEDPRDGGEGEGDRERWASAEEERSSASRKVMRDLP